MAPLPVAAAVTDAWARGALRGNAPWDSCTSYVRQSDVTPRQLSRGGRGGAAGVQCKAKDRKGTGNKKKGSSIPKHGGGEEAQAQAAAPVPPYTQGDIIMHSLELIDSHFRAVGSPIFSEPVEIASAAKALWDADFILMSHGTEEEPIFNYGNAKALEVFQTTWVDFTAMPSKSSCPASNHSDRQQLLAAAEEAVKDLKGLVRVSTQGRLFEIDQGVLWTLVASDGEKFGQAAVIRQWHFLDEVDEGEYSSSGQAPANEDTAQKSVEGQGESAIAGGATEKAQAPELAAAQVTETATSG